MFFIQENRLCDQSNISPIERACLLMITCLS